MTNATENNLQSSTQNERSNRTQRHYRQIKVQQSRTEAKVVGIAIKILCDLFRNVKDTAQLKKLNEIAFEPDRELRLNFDLNENK